MYALDKNRIIEAAKVKRDLRREGGSDPAIEVGIQLELKRRDPINRKSGWFIICFMSMQEIGQEQYK